MAARLPPETLSLKQFMVRRQVLSLYREIMKTLQEIPDKQHMNELKAWAREEFKQNKNEKDETAVQLKIFRGQQTLREIANTIALAR